MKQKENQENQNEPQPEVVTPNNLYINQEKKENSMSMNDIVNLAWGAKEILRDDFKKTEWGKIILPFILLVR